MQRLAQGHTTEKWQWQDLNPNLVTPPIMFYCIMLSMGIC